MTQLAQASSFNVEASLNAWMQTGLNAFTRPTWLSTMPAVVFDAPEEAAVMPCFSLIHIPVDSSSPFTGRWAGTTKGAITRSILDVSCWVSRSRSINWSAQLRTMRDMVLSVATANATPLIYDYAGTYPAAATVTAYKVNIGDVTLTPVEADVNPDVERVRVLIDYWFVFRAT
jgi:hypothetical protein